MAAISLTISESRDQIISGIPRSISITTNIPSTIFYTLDGSVPDTNSFVYVSPIIMEIASSITLQAFATNGVDISATFSKTYTTSILHNTRLPHAPITTGCDDVQQTNSQFPFGDSAPNPNFQYLSSGNAGITVFDPKKASQSNAFDASGNPTSFSNNPLSSYKLTYSTTNAQGEIGPGIGNFPSTTTVDGKLGPVEYTQESSSRKDKIFNPRALVIYQDASTDDPQRPPMINRQIFNLQDSEITKDGVFFYTNSQELGPPFGSFIKSFYNPRDNTINNYFFDSQVNRWIISKSPFIQKTAGAGNLYEMTFSSKLGRNVYEWQEFPRRFLPS